MPPETANATPVAPSERRRLTPIILFFVVAYAFSWLIGALLIATRQGLLSVPMSLHYASAYGPLVAAIVVTAWADGRAGLADLWRRATRTRAGRRGWLLGVGTPLGLAALALLVYAVSYGSLPDVRRFGEVDYLGDIGVVAALLLWIATYGFGEEVGWRGFAFARMATDGWVRAAVIIGLLWGVWHLPYFFYKESFMALGAVGFAGYLVTITLGSILLGWLYRETGGSILLVALWHGLFDFVSASPIAEGTGNMVISIVVIAWVITILRGKARPVLSPQ